MHETNTEVSLVTGVEYGGGPEAVSDNSATTVLKGKLPSNHCHIIPASISRNNFQRNQGQSQFFLPNSW